MCGIYGFQVVPGQTLSAYDATLLTYILANEMESRGRDSFGLVVLPEGQVYKGLGAVSRNGTQCLRAASTSSCFLGHTRQATVGEIVVENSHPFDAGDVIGVHNGSISNYKELNEKYNRECKVDSQHLFHHINDDLPLEDIQGHGTFFWARKSENLSRIYFARTPGGALTVAKLYREDPKKEDAKPIAVVWCSETYAIRKACTVLGLEFTEIMTKPEEVYFIAQGVVYHTTSKFELSTSFYKSNNNVYSPQCWGGNNKANTGGNVEDDSEVEETALSPSCDPLVRGLFCILQRRALNKKDRKATRRKLAYFQEKNKAKIKEPSVDNVHNGVGIKRHFTINFTSTSNDTKQKDTRTVYHCPGCECDLGNHLWGWCIDDYKQPCKAKIGAGCDVPYVPICSDCGHYLLDDIHTVDRQYDVVHCQLCGDYCIPESKIITKFFKEKNEENTQQEAATATSDTESTAADLSICELASD